MHIILLRASSKKRDLKSRYNTPMKKYKAILFDFDGTLVNTNKFIGDYTKEFMAQHGIDTTDPRKFEKEIRTGVSALSKEELGNYRREMSRRQPKEIQFYEGSLETLQKLKKQGYKLGLVTSSPKIRLEQIFEEKGMLGFFDVEIGAEDVTNRKPHPEPVLKAVETLGITPKEALFVGNAREDMEAGIAAKVDNVFFIENDIYYGIIGNWLEENSPVATVRNLRELIDTNIL
jgi:pyrophosphatase PpaX